MNIGRIILILFLLSPSLSNAGESIAEDQILGKWMSVNENVMVNVYKDGNQFKAKVIWFNDKDDPSRPMNTRLDINNSNQVLRKQKILGMNVLRNLKFNSSNDRWEDGVIYDAKSGREWSSVVYFNDDGLMEVKGFWKFELLCKTIEFKRVN